MARRILNLMKRLEIVLEREQLPEVCAILCEHATGYTLIPNVTGFGHHGYREGEVVVLVSVLTRDHVDPVIDRVVPLLNRRSGVVLISDVSVTNGEYFVPEVRDRQLRPPQHDGVPRKDVT